MIDPQVLALTGIATTRPRIRGAIEATTGAFLITFGVRLAMERR
jgi:hypothetical protein